MSEDNGRHVRPEDLPPHRQYAAMVISPGEFDDEHARGRFDADRYPIDEDGAATQVQTRELELAYARGVLVEKRSVAR